MQIMYRNHWIRPVLLVVALSTSLVAGVPPAASATPEKADEATQKNDGNGKQIRKTNDLWLKAREPLFREQARSLAKGYKETAEIVARQGGNPKPILDAAAYFERQSGGQTVGQVSY